MPAPPEKTHKSQTTPFTCHPNIIPTHRDAPNRSIRHSNAPPHTITYSMHHARQQPTRGQTNVPRISVIHVLQWEVNKRDGPPNPKRVQRLAATQRNAATQMNSVLMSSTSHLPHKSCKRLKTNAPSNKFFVQHQKKPRCLMLSSKSVDDAWMRMVTHRSSQTTPYIRDASCTLGHASLTITRDAHAPSVRNKSSRNEGYVRLTARHPPTNHIADIINNSSSSDADSRVTSIK
ncbi:hypothetical protein ECC02_010775 [Trypanosoma cruzi]|uniref:Uncharacterized protein n=1 Tax=Trypanosoma cruzi TaxID=5693 RepID=A0A7J6XFL5_TRYCR|nr:hypothetical protein ECC02_013876 [Trypanosoma cruzi]KAF5216448.1 hypothetical protein ECC02_010775 [Trypanosoma cruzi]